MRLLVISLTFFNNKNLDNPYKSITFAKEKTNKNNKVMSRFVVKNIEENSYLCEHGVFSKNASKAVLFPTYKRAQKEAKKLNKRMENFYSMNDNDFPMFRGKTCTKYQPVRID